VLRYQGPVQVKLLPLWKNQGNQFFKRDNVARTAMRVIFGFVVRAVAVVKVFEFTWFGLFIFPRKWKSSHDRNFDSSIQ